MAEIPRRRLPEGWRGHVAFSGGPKPFAYVPRQVVVAGRRGAEIARTLHEGRIRASREVLGRFTLLELADELDPLRMIEELRLEGVLAQPNHVLFAHCACECCCGIPPAARWQCVSGAPVYGSPVYGSPVYGSPVYGSPVYGSPVYGSPVYGSPVYGSPVYGSPVYGSPVYGSPVYGSPVYGSPVTGHRHSSAKPAPAPTLPVRQPPQNPFPVKVAVLDTGLAADKFRPHSLDIVDHPYPGWAETPDAEPDGFLDPAVGHGTFISGLIETLAPGCEVSVEKVLDNYGAGDEVTIATDIANLQPVNILNLSLGGYALQHMDVLAAAIRQIQDAGTVVVSSAGNDATCRQSFPAALPGVVSVGAVGPEGPAPFTNYGSWVRACAPGVDIVSTFFTNAEGPEPAPPGYPEPDQFAGWAVWSGTSFSAPTVVAALVREMQSYGMSAQDAVTRVIDAPGLLRIPDLGTVINLT